MKLPRIIPVLDVLGGHVVRAVGGRRSEYRPIVSRVTNSTEPLHVARDLLAVTGAKELYVADLDAIRGGELSEATRTLLNAIDVPVWLDGGFSRERWPQVRRSGGMPTALGGKDFASNANTIPTQSRGNATPDTRTWEPLQLPESVRPVVGFESVESPDMLSESCTFSLDLWNGELFGPWSSWGVASSRDLFGVLDRVVAMGVNKLIVLDLTAVGTNDGPSTLPLCQQIRQRFPMLELLTGGGVRGASDLAQLGEVGVDGVLIASAIHDGVEL
jgi:phosphoribosylformimino-5-aminoimidazole carboxamide ribotide isomerase